MGFDSVELYELLFDRVKYMLYGIQLPLTLFSLCDKLSKRECVFVLSRMIKIGCEQIDNEVCIQWI